jgi:phosphate transport system permease protein
MTDISATGAASSASTRTRDPRIAKRYAAERRFRLYGLAAILATALFVAALLVNIVIKGLPGFFEYRLLLSVNAAAEALDPGGSGDPAKIRAGDYDGLIRDALRDALPSVSTRADRKLLNGLLSAGAADDFRNLIVADPALIGKDVKITALLSDDADQFLKGYQSRIERHAIGSPLSIAPEGGLFRLSAEAAAFAPAMELVRRYASRELEWGRPELARLDQALSDATRNKDLAAQRLAAAGSDADAAAAASADIAKLDGDLAGLTAKRDALKAKLDALAARLDAGAGMQAVDANFPSLIVEAAGGAFRITEIAAAGALAEAVIPPTAAAASNWTLVTLTTPESSRRTSDREAIWLETLQAKGMIENGIAWRFFTSGDSREAELAGIKGALVGSALTLLVTLIICLPLGVGAAIYLEEFAPKNRITDIIEININNLAAVPSIVFGLLGLAMFLNFFGMPRSAPVVGGLVLALLVLPTIIIASRAALKAVPPSIKEAALGVGASHQQAIFHHVLPLAVPGIMTGTIIGMAHALGETAPLLMIGMVAFIVDVPQAITDAATVMPVQIYLWSDLPELAFQAKTAAAIIVLLVFLFVMNALAIYTRKRFERRW